GLRVLRYESGRDPGGGSGLLEYSRVEPGPRSPRETELQAAMGVGITSARPLAPSQRVLDAPFGVSHQAMGEGRPRNREGRQREEARGRTGIARRRSVSARMMLLELRASVSHGVRPP